MLSYRKIMQSRAMVTIAVALFIFSALLGLRQLGVFQSMELNLYDQFVGHRAEQSDTSSPVVLIKIDHAALRRYNYRLPDAVLAKALDRLLEYGSEAIGVDIFRDVPSDGRQALAAVVMQHPNIIMPERLLGVPISAPEFLDDTQHRQMQVGFIDLKQDLDGVIRRGLLYLWDSQGRASPSFALQLALKYLNRRGITLQPQQHAPHLVQLGDTPVSKFAGNDGGYIRADDGGYQFLMDYQQGQSAFETYTLSQVLNGDIAAAEFAGRVVIIGVGSNGTQDVHETPFSSGSKLIRPMYGMELHAHTVDQLIRMGLGGQRPTRVLPERYEILLIALFAFAGALAALHLVSLPSMFVAVIAVLGLPLVLGYLAFDYGFWLPSIPLPLSGLLAFGIGVGYVSCQERAEQRQIMQLFGSYVSPTIAEALWHQRDGFMEDGRPQPKKLTVTVLMTDLQGFTPNAEKMDPADVLDWLNGYMSAMTRLVTEYGGIVDDYAGDGLKANFGVPLPRTEVEIRQYVRRSVDCALAMGQALDGINAQSRAKGFPSVRLRIGIATGTVIAGSVGCKERMAYTTVGDTVNTAARLESFDKVSFDKELFNDYRILVGETTQRLMGNNYKTEALGTRKLRGRVQAIGIFRVYPSNLSVIRQKVG